MKRNLRLYSLFLLLLQFMFAGLFAQSGSVIRGTISDSETGERIIGATITEYDKDSRIIGGSISDVNGNFVLNVKNPDGIFKVNYIGYKAYEFTVAGRTSIEIKLESETIQMEEVVITAVSGQDALTGVAERDITGSRVKIDMMQSKHMGIASADQAMQGQMSGVDIMAVSGNPGSGSQIVIRGLSSLGGARPLIVVDNIHQDVRIDQSFDFASADQEDIGDLVNISPMDIKSIEVLKDASSTAVWGSKGANGVLLIETQRGRVGKTVFEYQGKYTINQQPPSIPMLNGNEYIMLQLEQLHNQNGVFELPQEIAYDINYEDFYNYSANTDWLDAITRYGFINDQYFKLSGGGEKTRYFASVNYHNNTGTTINTSLKRISTRINLDYNVSSKIRFEVNFNYTNSNKEDNYYDERDFGKNRRIRQMAYIKAPNMSIMEYDETGQPTGEYFTPIQSYQGDGIRYYNPVAVGNLSMNDKEENSVNSSFVLNYNMSTWLRFIQTISFQYLGSKTKQFLPIDAIGADWLNEINNKSIEVNGGNNKIMSRSQLLFRPRFKNRNHFMNAIAMMEIENGFSEGMWEVSGNGPSVEILESAAGSQLVSIGSSNSEQRGMGFLMSFNYKYKDRYILALNGRIDGSSKFGTDQRWGLFPSLSAGWRFSGEEWFSDLAWFSNGKLRAAYGQTGAQPKNAYDRHAIFNTANPNQYMEYPIIVPHQIQLDRLMWESVSSWNLGLDLGFLKDRFTLTGEIYNKKTENILWKDYKIPSTSGFPQLKWFNGGSLRNQGWELFVSGAAIRKENMGLNFNFNISQNVNSFIEFPESFNNEVDISIGTGKYPRKANIGQPVGSFYGFKYLGVWPSDEDVQVVDAMGIPLLDVYGNPLPFSYMGSYEFQGGDAKYEDVNHDGLIDLRDVQYLGDSNPNFMGGFGGSFRWRQFFVSAQFHFRMGYQIVNMVALQTEGMRDKNNQSKAVRYRWSYQGQDDPGMLPRAYMYHPANNLGSDRYVEDGDFLRLNNISIQYSLRKELCRRIGVKGIDIGLTMRKLLTITNYSGQDPEVPQTGNDPFWFGMDQARTPPPKAYTLSLSLAF
ncbi:MAG: SusC/RagA family TonB-linked outer membrane protein [Bacteroidetes bacterium]|nr:SusC/RagA family TonB-linked outer membrane protein [Bacteroidota bacterium]